ncbi:hypothetical protein AGLY_008180 [Aphis glycines]|uniref:Uncharacterized protein n=1 Tax=Aphis glycines TaxID=307491 RepID=A0A6G0TLB0_APHGL|nr:hypothetical protein AGLY_008180 [Aphis glycines]
MDMILSNAIHIISCQYMILSLNCESSFSTYANILSDNRVRFTTTEHPGKYMKISSSVVRYEFIVKSYSYFKIVSFSKETWINQWLTPNWMSLIENTPHCNGPVAARGPFLFFLYNTASSFFSLSDLSVVVFFTRITIPSDVTFFPTAKLFTTLIFIFSKCLLGPIPESINIFGEFRLPALRITSFFANTVLILFLYKNSTPIARFFSINTLVTCASVRTVRFFRFFLIGLMNALLVLIRSPCLAVDFNDNSNITPFENKVKKSNQLFKAINTGRLNTDHKIKIIKNYDKPYKSRTCKGARPGTEENSGSSIPASRKICRILLFLMFYLNFKLIAINEKETPPWVTF